MCFGNNYTWPSGTIRLLHRDLPPQEVVQVLSSCVAVSEPRWQVSVKRKRYSVEQIIGELREAEVRLSQGVTVKEVSRELGVTEQTYYRWRKEYGGLKVSQARRLKELERENSRLKKAVADLTLDKVILKEALEGNY